MSSKRNFQLAHSKRAKRNKAANSNWLIEEVEETSDNLNKSTLKSFTCPALSTPSLKYLPNILNDQLDDKESDSVAGFSVDEASKTSSILDSVSSVPTLNDFPDISDDQLNKEDATLTEEANLFVSNHNNGRGYWQLPKSFSLSFKDVPTSGVIFERLPSDTTIVQMLVDSMPKNLTKVFDDQEQEFQDWACRDLAKHMWNIIGAPFMLKIPWEDLHGWLVRLIPSSPIFHMTNMNKYSVVKQRFDAEYKRCLKRKKKLDEIIEGLSKDIDEKEARKIQNWPSTESIIKEIFEMLCLYGHKDKDEALLDAVNLHFDNITYTNYNK